MINTDLAINTSNARPATKNITVENYSDEFSSILIKNSKDGISINEKTYKDIKKAEDCSTGKTIEKKDIADNEIQNIKYLAVALLGVLNAKLPKDNDCQNIIYEALNYNAQSGEANAKNVIYDGEIINEIMLKNITSEEVLLNNEKRDKIVLDKVSEHLELILGKLDKRNIADLNGQIELQDNIDMLIKYFSSDNKAKSAKMLDDAPIISDYKTIKALANLINSFDSIKNTNDTDLNRTNFLVTSNEPDNELDNNISSAKLESPEASETSNLFSRVQDYTNTQSQNTTSQEDITDGNSKNGIQFTVEENNFDYVHGLGKGITFSFNNIEKASTSENITTDEFMKLGRLIEDNIINTYLSNKPQNKEFEIQLKPESLGKIIIRMRSTGEGMNIKIYTSNQNVKDVLGGQLFQMENSIKEQGVQLNNIDIVFSDFANDLLNSFGQNNRKLKEEFSGRAIEEYEQYSTMNDIAWETKETLLLHNSSVEYIV